MFHAHIKYYLDHCQYSDKVFQPVGLHFTTSNFPFPFCILVLLNTGLHIQVLLVGRPQQKSARCAIFLPFWHLFYNFLLLQMSVVIQKGWSPSCPSFCTRTLHGQQVLLMQSYSFVRHERKQFLLIYKSMHSADLFLQSEEFFSRRGGTCLQWKQITVWDITGRWHFDEFKGISHFHASSRKWKGCLRMLFY